MRECLNCKSIVRDTDIYCRNCGCLLQSNNHYVLINILIILVIIGISILIILFIASLIVN